MRRYAKLYNAEGIKLAKSEDGWMRLELPPGYTIQSFFNGPEGGRIRLAPVAEGGDDEE